MVFGAVQVAPKSGFQKSLPKQRGGGTLRSPNQLRLQRKPKPQRTSKEHPMNTNEAKIKESEKLEKEIKKYLIDGTLLEKIHPNCYRITYHTLNGCKHRIHFTICVTITTTIYG